MSFITMETPNGFSTKNYQPIEVTIEDAKRVAAQWCDTTEVYYQTGYTDDDFNNPTYNEKPDKIVTEIDQEENGNYIIVVEDETEIFRVACAVGQVNQRYINYASLEHVGE